MRNPEKSIAKKVSLGELCAEEPCYGASTTAIVRTNENQPKYIRITDFDDFGIAPDHEYMTAASYSDKHILQAGDILFARSGATVGKTYYYDGSIGTSVFAGYCIRFRFDKKKVLPKFVYWYTKTETYKSWVQGIQRPSGQPNINKEEYKSFEIILPSIEVQQSLSTKMDEALNNYKEEHDSADEYIINATRELFSNLGINFPDYKPSLYNFVQLKDIKEFGLYCNSHSAYLNHVFQALKDNKHFAGCLEDYVVINPNIERKKLQDDTEVSFVPMSAVEEKTNGVEYTTMQYENVKTGFTPFQKGDLLWAKITPCMQNGKSFLSDDMPTQFGFGSTEFHVLRQKSDHIYMPFLWVLLTDDHILEAAQGMFSGSAGQQRVPDTFLKKFPIILPPLKKQKALADKVFSALSKAKALRQQAKQEWATAKERFEKELLGE